MQVLPDWIQLDKDVRARQAQWADRVEEYARVREEALARAGAQDRADVLDGRRDLFLEQAADGLRELNRLIDRLNLIAPTLSQQRVRVDLPERMAELEARFPRLWPAREGSRPSWQRGAEGRALRSVWRTVCRSAAGGTPSDRSVRWQSRSCISICRAGREPWS